MLSQTPPQEWTEAFNNPSGVSFILSMRQPRLLRDQLTLEVLKADDLARSREPRRRRYQLGQSVVRDERVAT